MQSDYHDPVAREREQRRELRAGIDVMFEALSHIQASLETSSKGERKKSYRTFKEALYDRFEYLVEKRREEAPPLGTHARMETTVENGAGQEGGSSKQGGSPDDSGTEGQGRPDGDALEKLWPTPAEK